MYIDCWKHAYRVNIHILYILRNKCINFLDTIFMRYFFIKHMHWLKSLNIQIWPSFEKIYSFWISFVVARGKSLECSFWESKVVDLEIWNLRDKGKAGAILGHFLGQLVYPHIIKTKFMRQYIMSKVWYVSFRICLPFSLFYFDSFQCELEWICS